MFSLARDFSFLFMVRLAAGPVNFLNLWSGKRMKLIILGATGRTGTMLVEQAIQRGHHVTAFIRSPNKIPASAGLLSVVQGDPCNVAQLEAALRGQDAVLSALGSQGLGPATLLGDAAVSTVEAMSRACVRRLIVVSSALLFPDLGVFASVLRRFVFHNAAYDSLVMENVVSGTTLDWTIVRPPRLISGPHTGQIRVQIDQLPKSGRTMTRGDLAHCMLDEVESERHVRKIIGVCH